MTELHLDVPYYSQNDTNNGLTDYWQRRSCGILALKMVIDFYLLKKSRSALDLTEIFDKAMANGGVNKAGNWTHAALVKTARDYGFRSWRRIWNLSSGQTSAVLAEGADEETLESNQLQQQREALPTLVYELEKGHPVIISVAKNFDEVDKPHLVVLTGIKRGPSLGEYQGIYYNDPYSPTKRDRKDRFVAIQRFNEKWNYTAIFVEEK